MAYSLYYTFTQSSPFAGDDARPFYDVQTRWFDGSGNDEI